MKNEIMKNEIMKNESKPESISEIRPESKENAAVEFADGIKIIRNIPYTEERETRNCYDLYLPAEEGTDTEAPQTLVIYFYGGSLKKGCKDKQAFPGALIRELREHGAAHGSVAVACPDYRLIPDVMYPTFINDAAEAVRAATERYSTEYGSPKRIFIAGYSAGAYISMMLCFDKKYLAVQGIDADKITGYLLMSGQPTKHMSVLECDGMDKRAIVVDQTSALYHIGPHGAPLLIVTSDMDLKNRREQNMLLCTALKTFGYDSKVDFVNLGDVPHGAMAKKDENGRVPLVGCAADFIDAIP